MPANTADTDNLVIALRPYYEGRPYASRAGPFLARKTSSASIRRFGDELAIAAIRRCNSDLRALCVSSNALFPEWLDQMIPDYDIIGPQSPGARVPHRRIYFYALARFGAPIWRQCALWVIGRHQLVSINPADSCHRSDFEALARNSLLGWILSAMLLYGAGRWLGQRNVITAGRQKPGRVNSLISEQGVLAITASRMVPVAPYSLS